MRYGSRRCAPAPIPCHRTSIRHVRTAQDHSQRLTGSREPSALERRIFSRISSTRWSHARHARAPQRDARRGRAARLRAQLEEYVVLDPKMMGWLQRGGANGPAARSSCTRSAAHKKGQTRGRAAAHLRGFGRRPTSHAPPRGASRACSARLLHCRSSLNVHWPPGQKSASVGE